MSLPILALFSRAQRAESRKATTYAFRVVLVAIIAAYLMFYHIATSLFGAPGLQFFGAVVHINLGFITILGVSHFASAITEEKEEMTLGLLRMTRLSPLSILLAKSTSRLIDAVLLVLAQFPFTLLAITLGGVMPVQVFAAYATLLSYLVLLSGLASLCSLICNRTGSATTLVGVLLLAFFAAPEAWKDLLAVLVRRGVLSATDPTCAQVTSVLASVAEASPFTRIGEIMETGFSGFPIGYQVLVNAAAGVFCFCVAWISFDVLTREQKEAGPTRRFLAKRRSWLRFLNPGRAWRNALMWKDFNFIAGGWRMMALKFVVFGVLVGGIYRLLEALNTNIPFAEYCRTLRYVAALAVFFELAVCASRIFREETRWRTLPGIMALPLSTREVAYRKVAGCLLGIIPSASWLLALFALSFGSANPSDVIWNSGPGWVILHSLCQAVFFAHLVAYLSLELKRGALAIAFAVWLFGLQSFFGMATATAFVMFGTTSLTGFLGGSCVFLVVGTIMLHVAIGRRLELAAGE